MASDGSYAECDRVNLELREWLGAGLIALPVGLLAAALAATSGEISPLVPLVTLLALGIAALCLWRPMVAVYLAIAAIPLDALHLPVGVALITPSEALFLGAGFGWAFVQLLDRRSVIPEGTRVAAPLATFVLAAVPALFLAVKPELVLKQMFVAVALLAIACMVIRDGDGRTVRNLLLVLALAGGVSGLVAVLGGSAAEQSASSANYIAGRAVGPFAQPNTLGTFLALAIPAQVVLLLRGAPSIRLIALPSLVLALLGLGLSFSRGALIALVLSSCVLLLWRPFRGLAVVAGTALVLLALINVNPVAGVVDVGLVADRLLTFTDPAGPAAELRKKVNETAPAIIVDHPLGIGAFNLPEIAPRYGLTDISFTDKTYANVHSLYLSAGLQRGLLGLGALVWLTWAVAQTLRQALHGGERKESAFAFGIMASLFAFAVTGLFFDPLTVNSVMLIVFVLIGCAELVRRAAVGSKEALGAAAPAG